VSRDPSKIILIYRFTINVLLFYYIEIENHYFKWNPLYLEILWGHKRFPNADFTAGSYWNQHLPTECCLVWNAASFICWFQFRTFMVADPRHKWLSLLHDVSKYKKNRNSFL